MRWTPSRDVEVAIRRFPDRAERMAQLAQTSEPFRDMCEELAAAEDALSALGPGATPQVIERRAECEGWIVRLIKEMSEALDAANVVPLSGRRRP
jgi:hypothetical protein